MNKMIMCAAVCGILSSAAVAEPLTLNDNELETVNGGMISVSTINQEAFLDRIGLEIGIQAAVKPENWSTLQQKQAVKTDSDKFDKLGFLCECLLGLNEPIFNNGSGEVTGEQNFTGQQNAGVSVGNINIPGVF